MSDADHKQVSERLFAYMLQELLALFSDSKNKSDINGGKVNEKAATDSNNKKTDEKAVINKSTDKKTDEKAINDSNNKQSGKKANDKAVSKNKKNAKRNNKKINGKAGVVSGNKKTNEKTIKDSSNNKTNEKAVNKNTNMKTNDKTINNNKKTNEKTINDSKREDRKRHRKFVKWMETFCFFEQSRIKVQCQDVEELSAKLELQEFVDQMYVVANQKADRVEDLQLVIKILEKYLPDRNIQKRDMDLLKCLVDFFESANPTPVLQLISDKMKAIKPPNRIIYTATTTWAEAEFHLRKLKELEERLDSFKIWHMSMPAELRNLIHQQVTRIRMEDSDVKIQILRYGW